MWLVDLLFELPLWLLAAVLNVWLMAFALGGYAYYAAALVQSAMLLYGLVAALTAVGVWARYSQVSTSSRTKRPLSRACGATCAATPHPS